MWLIGVAKDAGVDTATAEKVIARKPAFLLTTGHVLDAEAYRSTTPSDVTYHCTDPMDAAQTAKCPLVEFSSAAVTDDTLAMDLYVVVRHVNHLDIISSQAMATTATPTNRYIYDFTKEDNGQIAARGGSVAMKKVGADTVMFVGDVNGDANINATDYLQILKNPAATITTDTQVYDINYDGVINSTDTRSALLRSNLGRAVQLP